MVDSWIGKDYSLGPVYIEVGDPGKVRQPFQVGWKNNPRLHAILKPRHPGVHFLKTGMVAKHVNKKKMVGKRRVLAINALLVSLTVLDATYQCRGWYQSLHQRQLARIWFNTNPNPAGCRATRLGGSPYLAQLSYKRDQIKMRGLMDRRVTGPPPPL